MVQVFHPPFSLGREYRVNGIQYPLTMVGINAAITAANADGGGHVIVSGGFGAIVYAGTSVTPLSSVWLDIGKGTWLETSGSGTTQYILYRTGGLDGGTRTFTGTVARGARAGTLSGTISGLVKDDLVGIVRTSDGQPYQIMKVRSISGTAITFYDKFEHAYTTGFTVQKVLLPLKNFKFSGEIRNPANTNTEVRAVLIYCAEDLDFDDCIITGFDQNVSVQLAISTLYTYNVSIRHSNFRDCGSAGAGGMILYAFSHYYLDDVVFNADAGQPFNIEYGTDFACSNSVISGSGRVVEFDSVAGIALENTEITCSTIASDNCIALESQPFGDVGAAGFVTRDVRISRCSMSGAAIALNVFDEFITNLTVESSQFYNNTQDISVPKTCVNVHIMPDCSYTTISLLSGTAYNYKWVTEPRAIVVRQSGSLASIQNTYCRLLRTPTKVEFEFVLTVLDGTGAVAGNVVEVELPSGAWDGAAYTIANANATAVTNFAVIGSGVVYDNSATTFYPVIVLLSTTTGRIKLVDAWATSTGLFGTGGSGFSGIALAVNDVIKVQGSYEVA